MSDLLLELFSEEIPAGMQGRAGDNLQRLVCEGLTEAGLDVGEARNFAGPRRLTLVIDGLPEKSPDISEEKKGPRVGSPDKAIEGFLRGAGLTSIDDAEVVSDEKRGDFYVARIEKPGRETAEIIAELIPDVIRQFPWPKSQHWGAGSLRWVRPLHSILCLLGGNTVSFDVDGIASGNETRGHRFLAPGVVAVKDFADYEAKLRKAYVMLDAKERIETILGGAQALADKAKLELVADPALLAENAGLVEWPVVLAGVFDEAFLDVPSEVIITAIKKHQKCFSLRNAGSGNLANTFILVSNLIADDGGEAIIKGNERVIRARLSDAKFFWDQDKKITLEDRLSELKSIIFQQKFDEEFASPVSSQFARVERLEQFAHNIAGMIGANPSDAKLAARLCKADLVSGMVVEFPDLQGLMGKYYALEEKIDPSVAAAIEEHYQPQGPNDAVPTNPVSISLALADKLDTLVGFWAIDEKPTGSKDPFALRRAALGIIRILVENSIRLNLERLIRDGFGYYGQIIGYGHVEDLPEDWNSWPDAKRGAWLEAKIYRDLLAFFHDRLKVHLRDRGARHDLLDAVISEDADDLLMIVARVDALGRFLETDDGANLLAGVKRAQNILRIEEKKDGKPYAGEVSSKLFQKDEEKVLARAIGDVSETAVAKVGKEDFEGAMAEMAKLRSPVDAFFDHVTVNADEPELRENRLKLLNQIREATLAVADFSKIEG